jgi:hypothetical protein
MTDCREAGSFFASSTAQRQFRWFMPLVERYSFDGQEPRRGSEDPAEAGQASRAVVDSPATAA